MKRYDVWEIVPKRKQVQAIPIKWIFTIKSNGTYKARLVVIGCRDKNKATRIETTSPTPTSGSIRWLFILASKFGWNMWQLDLTNAYLNSKIHCEKYVAVPKGINYDPTKYMCRLKKALYGLDIAPKCFNIEIDSFLKSQGFEQNKREPCIYTKMNETLITIILVFVDDFILTGNDTISITDFLDKFTKKYEVKNLGFPSTFVGIEIVKRNDAIFLHQKSYAESIVRQFYTLDETKLQISKWSTTPMPPISDHKRMAVLPENTFPYRQVLGALIYLANYTRPDLSFPVNYLARFQTVSTSLHWTLLQRILYYVSKTSELGISCPKNDQEFLPNERNMPDLFDVYVDADHAGDTTRKSTTGFIVRLFQTPVMWCSRLQPTIAEGTTEAEYIALNEAAHAALFFTRLTNETLKINSHPVTFYEDNYAALCQATTKVSKGKLKHVELRYFKIQEYVENGFITIEQVQTDEQLADLLTKPLLLHPFEKCRNALLKPLHTTNG